MFTNHLLIKYFLIIDAETYQNDIDSIPKNSPLSMVSI